MAYSLAGDRGIEYGYLRQLPKGTGTAFEFGPAPATAYVSLFAVKQGYSVTAVGLEQIRKNHPKLKFIQGDLLTVKLTGKFDWILNISTVEHCGLAGRYGVTVADADADLKAMHVLRTLMKPTSRMLMTIPVGLDTVVGVWHRVYGAGRLPKLLKGYEIVHQAFWAKSGGVDVFEPVSKSVALATKPIASEAVPPRNYYALGGFTLKRKG